MNIRFALYGMLAGIAIITSAYYKGVWDEHEKYEAAAKSVRAQDVQIAKAMQPLLTHTLTLSHTVTVTLTKQVTKYVDRYIPAPGAASQARPAYYLTVGSVQLWGCALSPDTPGCAAGPTTTTSPFNLSPVTFDYAETNAILNFGQYRDCRTIVAGWQSWYRQVSEVKP